MSQQQAVLRALAFMEDHLCAAVDVAGAAAAAGYSLYHFCRVFSKHTRHTPYDYLIRRRMTQAAAAVIQSDHKIIDIALDYQFESHEGFTRAFGRMFGCSPSEAREQGYVSDLCRLPRLTGAHLTCLHQHNGFPPELVTQPPATGQRQRLPVTERWPPDTSPTIPTIPAGDFARFALHENPDALVLDWLLHVWLFYAPYNLRCPVLLHQPDGDQPALLVPVCRT